MLITRFMATMGISLTLGAPLMAEENAQALPMDIADALVRGDYSAARIGLAPLAEQPGNAEVDYQFGLLLLEGRGGPRDPQEALRWLEEAAADDHMAATVLLARAYLTGQAVGVTRNPDRAAELFTMAAAQGNAEAFYYLGLLYRAGTGVAQDHAQAFSHLLSAAEAGHIEAQYELSKSYAEGIGTEPDDAQALHWLRATAEAGHTQAQFFLANALETGQGAPRDKAEALLWFRRAAEGGVPIAQRILGTKHLMGDDGLEPHPEEAERWLTDAAQANDPGAMHNLAIAYGGEHGVPRDDAKALHWYARASDTGLGRATYALAHYHETGRGVPVNIKMAAQLYRLAFEQGDPRGARRLGYLTGQGALAPYVPPHFSVDWTLAAARDGDGDARDWLRRHADDGLRGAQTAYGLLLLDHEDQTEVAADYLERAALTGDVTAQFHLGRLFTTGKGVPLDYVAGHKWLNIAATSGHAGAVETRELIGNLMTPHQISEAQTAARVFFETASDRLPSGLLPEQDR